MLDYLLKIEEEYINKNAVSLISFPVEKSKN